MLNSFEKRYMLKYDAQIMDPYSNIGQTRVQCSNLTVSVYLEEFGNSVCVCVCVEFNALYLRDTIFMKTSLNV